MKYYVYAYLDPRKIGNYQYDSYKFDYEPFYIGKGSNNRIDIHLKEKSNTHKSKLTNKLLKLGLEPIRIKLFENISEQDAYQKEIELIKLIGRSDLKLGPLTNLTNGGDGTPGCIFSEKELKRRSDASKGENNPWYKNPIYGFKDKHHTEKTKKILSKKCSGIEPWNKGLKGWKNDKFSKDPIQIDKIIYSSIRNAYKQTRIKPIIIYNRCNSPDFPNYFYINSIIEKSIVI